MAVGSGARPRSASVGKGADKHLARDAAGIPLYLQRVKASIASEEQLVAQQLGLNRREDNAPPGCVLMPDAERLETLGRLHRKKEELEARHMRLPLKIETVGQKSRAEEIEKELKAVEQGIANFSQPKVFVRVA